ncbi:MAG TPA: sulfatase [Actinomycetes bacterium]
MLLAGLLAPREVAVPAGPVVTAHGDRPNVVLVVTDDQRVESIAGMPQVQRLLVQRGTRFSNGMVPTALCCPSRASILTGLYSHHTRVFGNGDVGGPTFGGWAQFHRRGMEYRTLATALHRRGYRTGFFGKYLNDFSRLSPDGFTPPGWDTFTAFKHSRGAYFSYRLTDGTWHGNRPEDYSTDVLADRAGDFVRQTPEKQPVFVLFAPYGPHSPYVPAPRHAGAADRLPDTPVAVLPEAGVGRVAQNPEPRWVVRRQAHDLATADGVRRGQEETLLSVDEAVASLLRTLDRTGRDRDTLFVFMSDNGYLWGEHGLVGKDVPYAPATRIPLVIRWDGRVPAGVVDRRLALNVDVAGTIARAAGAPMSTDGLDLLGKRKRKGFVLEAMTGYRKRPAYCGWRTKRWMYVRYASGGNELYDYRTDPGERHNLASDPSLSKVKDRLQRKARKACVPEPPGFNW